MPNVRIGPKGSEKGDWREKRSYSFDKERGKVNRVSKKKEGFPHRSLGIYAQNLEGAKKGEESVTPRRGGCGKQNGWGVPGVRKSFHSKKRGGRKKRKKIGWERKRDRQKNKRYSPEKNKEPLSFKEIEKQGGKKGGGGTGDDPGYNETRG